LLGVGVIGALTWYVESRTPTESRANDLSLRDVPDRSGSGSGQEAQRQVVPQASIPWKRDTDVFAAVSVGAAQLPWRRRVDAPDAVMLIGADLPWSRPVKMYAPVLLQTAALPWRY
jgi:hypothetical protein